MDMTDAPWYPGGGVNVDSPEWENTYFIARLKKPVLKSVIRVFERANKMHKTEYYTRCLQILKTQLSNGKAKKT